MAQRILPIHTEEDCARMAQYEYIQQNVFQPGIEKENRAAVTRNIGNRKGLLGDHDQPAGCKCSLVEMQKCNNSKCVNRKYRVSCRADCRPFCRNNPFVSGFAIGTSTYIKEVPEVGWGLFASRDIPRYTWMGEYTGRVYGKEEVTPPASSQYIFEFQDCPCKIDPHRQGSAARLVNHSCRPNCIPKAFIHAGLYKLLFISDRKISAGDEITIDYRWKYRNFSDMLLCKCGHPNTPHYIGHLIVKNTIIKPIPRSGQASRQDVDENDVGYDIDPNAIVVELDKDDIDYESDKSGTDHEEGAAGNEGDHVEVETARLIAPDSLVHQLIGQVHMPTLPRVETFVALDECSPSERPADYVETHKFGLASIAFGIMQRNGRPRIVGGSVVECYSIKETSVFIYVLRSTMGGVMSHHLPRWLLFHHFEDALFALNNLYSERENGLIVTRSMPTASRANAAYRTTMDFVEYSGVAEMDRIPRTIIVHNRVFGQFAVGVPFYTLVRATNLRGEEDVPVAGCSADGVGPGNGYVSNEDDFDEETPRSAYMPYKHYLSDYRMPIDDLVSKYRDEVNFSRIFEHTCEAVALIYLAVLPPFQNVSQTTARSMVQNVLHGLYFNTIPHQRRFLLFDDYRMAVELWAEGAWRLNWCSLCQHDFNYTSENALRNHFNEYHAICASNYICPNCKRAYTKPSLFVYHVVTCNEMFGRSVRVDYDPFLMNAFADHIATRAGNHARLHIIPPGLASMRNRDHPNLAHRQINTESDQNLEMNTVPRLRMNPLTKRPYNQRHILIPTSFKNVQQQYKELKNWANLRPSACRRAVSRVLPDGQPILPQRASPARRPFPVQGSVSSPNVCHVARKGSGPSHANRKEPQRSQVTWSNRSREDMSSAKRRLMDKRPTTRTRTDASTTQLVNCGRNKCPQHTTGREKGTKGSIEETGSKKERRNTTACTERDPTPPSSSVSDEFDVDYQSDDEVVDDDKADDTFDPKKRHKFR